MILFYTALLLTGLCSIEALPRPASQKASSRKQPFQVPERQQYVPELQYDFSLLDPQFQIPSYNFIGDKQHFPRVQPQIVLYHGAAAPGQPFLLQPGSPPGNFLLPQPGPNVIIRNVPATPARPVFVAGYPKPAHIPPIEKDAEEIPTNPANIPPLKPKTEEKPEKLETFNEDDNTKKTATEAEVLAEAEGNPEFNIKTNLKPGQRFFILNGQPIFSNFPYYNQVYPGVNFKSGHFLPTSFLPQQPAKNIVPFPNSLFETQQVESIAPSHRSASPEIPQSYPENLVLLNQPGLFQNEIFLTNPNLQLNLEQPNGDKTAMNQELRNNENNSFRISVEDNAEQDEGDSVVVDASEELRDDNKSDETDAEVVSAANKINEPSISQAQPSAISLAGPGGVASAAPRGTAFVGREGVAVSSPQATAVAGPREQEKMTQGNNKKPIKRRQ